MSQFKMLRSLIYVLVGLGWLTFLGGLILAAASFLNNTWTIQLNLPLIASSHAVTGFAVLLSTSIMTIVFLASAECLALLLSLHDNVHKVREFFHKK
jgi:hypothetical protein